MAVDETKPDVDVLDSEYQVTNPGQDKILDDLAVQTARTIIDSVKVDDSDREVLDAKSEMEAFDLQTQLSGFINKKLDIVESADIKQIKSGIDLLDAISGGGFSSSGFTMIVGQPGSYKTTIAAQILGYNQRLNNGKMLSIYYDTESATTMKRLGQLGVNYPPIKPLEDCTIEAIFKTIEALVSFKEAKQCIDTPAMIFWDSIANTSTEKERTTDDINSTIGLKQKLISQLLPRYLTKMRKYNIALIGINQFRESLEMGQFAPAPALQHMSGSVIPGGKSLQYNAMHILKLQNRGELKEEQYGFRGNRVEATFIKNKFHTPHTPVTLLCNYQGGVDNFFTNYQLLVDEKRLQSGAWNKLVDLPGKTFRTKDARSTYQTDAAFKEAFDRNVAEVLDIKFKE